MKFMMPGMIVVIWALLHWGVSGAPVPDNPKNQPPFPVGANNSSNVSSSSSPITITTSGNMSGWVDQLALGQVLPLESLGANLSGPGPLEVHINIYDFRVNNEPTKANPSISYFPEDDTSESDYSSEESSSSEEDDVTLSQLLFGPDETDAKLQYGLIDSKSPVEGLDNDLNKPETRLSYMLLEEQAKPKGPASETHSTTNAVTKESMKLSIEDLDDMTRMYTGMALCTRIIKYMAMLDGSNNMGTQSGISVDALTYFSNLFNCLTTNNIFNEEARSSLEPRPSASPPSLSSFDKLQLKILDSSPTTTTSTKKPTVESDTIGIIFVAEDDGVEQEYVGGELTVQDQSVQSAFLASPVEMASSPAESSSHIGAAAAAAPCPKSDEGLSETDDKPVEDFDEEYSDDRGFMDDEAIGVYLLAVIVTLFFLFAFVAGMFYDNVLWRKIMKLRGTETDVNANECNKKVKPIWLVLKKNEVVGGDEQKRAHPSLLIKWI